MNIKEMIEDQIRKQSQREKQVAEEQRDIRWNYLKLYELFNINFQNQTKNYKDYENIKIDLLED